MRRSRAENRYYGEQDDAAETFFREAAKNEGLSYHQWCDKYGIMDRAATTVIQRHEAPLMLTSKDRINKAPSVLKGADQMNDPRMTAVRLPSDFNGQPPESPARRRVADDAAEAAD